jgi:hypothetical protein
MKWSRLAYCAVIAILHVPNCAHRAARRFRCVVDLHVHPRVVDGGEFPCCDLAAAPLANDLDLPRKTQPWEWLSNPRLDGLVNVGTFATVLGFPALLWFPLIFWLFG